MSFPSECVLERRVRTDGDVDVDDTDLPLYILDCKDRKAEGYRGKALEIYTGRLKKMRIGVRLAVAPPAVSYLTILGGRLFADIVAVDNNVIVIRLRFTADGGRFSYLIYDAVALSLRLFPLPKDPSWIFTLSSNISIARPCQGDLYALVLTGRLPGVDEGDSLYLWRPSSPSPPWLEKKQTSFPDLIDWSMNRTDMHFSFSGHAYWVDLLRGVSYCSCDALFDDNTSVAKFDGFIPLPSGAYSFPRISDRVSRPVAYRTMGIVRDSIRFVSINGFQSYVKLEDRTVTVWKLMSQDMGWKRKHELSLKTLWDFQGFGDLPKNLTPMYPNLSTNDPDVVYLLLGPSHENQLNWKFIAGIPCYVLAVHMRNKIVTSVPLEGLFPANVLSCGFSKSLCEALIPFSTDPVKKQPKRNSLCKALVPRDDPVKKQLKRKRC